jgi:hypothetical protein
MTTDKFFIPVTAVYDNRNPHNLPAHVAHECATPYSAPVVDFDEVEVLAASLGYQIINMGTTKKPMFRLLRDGVMIPSNQYGGGLALFDVRAYLEAERHQNAHDIHVESALEVQYDPVMESRITAVIRDIPQCHYAKAVRIQEPSWFYDPDESVNVCLERQRMDRMMDRDSDRAANFAMSARYGCGALI